MFNKFTFKNLLPATLLLASVGAYAQVTLDDGTTSTWAKVVEALNGTQDLTALQQAVTNAQSAASLVEPKTETTVDKDIQAQMDAATAFKAAYIAYYNGDDNSTGKIWCDAVENRDKETSLTISFVEQSGLNEMSISQFYDEYTAKTPKANVAALFLYLNAKNTAYPVSTYQESNQKNLVTTAADFLNNTIPTLKSFQTTQNTDDYDKALQAVTDAQNALTAAQKAQTAYQTLTLTADVTAKTTIKNFAGTIIGNGYAIDAEVPVFTKLTGDIHNVAVNGDLASATAGATLNNVAVWNNSTRAGKYYDAAGAAADYGTLGALAFAARANFGVTGGKLARVPDANKVYDITVYENADNNFQSYVTYADGVYTNVDNNEAITVGKNVFVKSATGDLNANNVIYNGKAENVVIEDGVNFFCPEDITATNVTYNRSFTEGHNAVCLPFAVSETNIDAQFATYEKEDTEANAFVFTFQTGPIAANTPMILKAKTNGTLENLKNVAIAATPKNYVVEGANNSFGVLKKATIQEILGASKASMVYGFVNGEFCKATGDPATQTVSAFRMVITSAAASAAPRRIVFLGEDNDTNAVESVSDNAAALEVAGGYGELTINAASDCGNVAVYTMDGKVAANANVAAGTTTVNLSKGVYVVMGKKVAVK